MVSSTADMRFQSLSQPAAYWPQRAGSYKGEELSEVIRFTLRGDVSWINADTYPDAGGCNILCLTDRQVSIIRQMVYPHALSPSRFVLPIFDRWFTYPAAELLAEHVDEVDDLLDKLGTGAIMDCTEIIAALDLIAQRLNPPADLGLVFSNASLPAGGSSHTVLTAAADSLTHVTSAVVLYVGTGASLVTLSAYYAGTTVTIASIPSPASGLRYERAVNLVLSAGHELLVAIAGATQGDDLYVWVTGYVDALVS